MRISFLNSLPVRNNRNTVSTQSSANRISSQPFILPKDTISFTSSTCATEYSQNVEQALNMGDEILQELNNGADKITALGKIKAEYPGIEILSIDKLRNTQPDTMYCAFLEGKLDEQLNSTDIKFYANMNPITKKDKNLNYFFTTDVIHEYTHLKQLGDQKILDQQRKICNNDKLYYDIVQGIGDCLFSTFDNRIQAETVIKSFDLMDRANIEKYGKLLPRRNTVLTPDLLLKNAGFKDKKDFSNFIGSILLDNTSNVIYSIMQSNGENLGGRVYYDRFKLAVSTENGIKKLVKDIKEYCKISAMKEKEAYTTEAEFGKRYIQTYKTTNLDAFRMYYTLLENAFDEIKL